MADRRAAHSMIDALLSTARNDVLVKATFWVFLVLATILTLAAGLPGHPLAASVPGLLYPVLHLSLLVLTLVSLLRNLDAVDRPWERSFWKRLALGYGSWLLGAVLSNSVGAFPVDPLRVVCYALSYVFVIRAAEGQPHRPPPPFRTVSERLLTWPSVTFFVLGLLIYFVFIPLATAESPAAAPPVAPPGESPAPAGNLNEFYFYALLDLYLSFRFLFLARIANTRRWRVLYAAQALPWLVIFLSADLGTIASQTAFVWPALPEWWLNVSFVVQVWAARLRHHAFPKEWEPTEPDSPLALSTEKLSFMFSARTLTLGVIFPVIHILAVRYELIDAPGHGARQALVLIWLIFFGVVALFQHRHLEQTAQDLWLDQVSFEEALRTSEKDLRLIIEKDRAAEMLQHSEEKFVAAFRACPYTLVITSLVDGRFLEANPAFEDMFGYRRDEVVGRSVAQLGLWLDPGDVSDISRRIEQQRQVQEIEITFRRKSGEERLATLSTAELELEGERCLLSIVSDVTERRRAEKRLEALAELVDQAEAAIFEVDAVGRIGTWNGGAARLCGWTAEEAVGMPSTDVVAAPNGARTDLAVAEGPSEWAGELRLVTRAGGMVEARGCWRRLAEPAGSRLVIAVPSGGARGGSTRPHSR